MIYGMSTFTFFHVLLSLIGILTGVIVLIGMLAAKRLNLFTFLFLASTVLTSVTGFLFPFHGFLASHGVGTISLIVLAIAIYSRYKKHLSGGWRTAYVVNAMIALYLNVFVLIAQVFQKLPALKAIEPAQSATLFKAAQGITLLVFVLVTIVAAQRFKLHEENRA